jgi:hypothetical protein
MTRISEALIDLLAERRKRALDSDLAPEELQRFARFTLAMWPTIEKAMREYQHNVVPFRRNE